MLEVAEAEVVAVDRVEEPLAGAVVLLAGYEAVGLTAEVVAGTELVADEAA